jgi:hypothetical protein
MSTSYRTASQSPSDCIHRIVTIFLVRHVADRTLLNLRYTFAASSKPRRHVEFAPGLLQLRDWWRTPVLTEPHVLLKSHNEGCR